MHMNDAQLLNVIEHFVTKRIYHYALMINGSWGCGKTYFTNQRLMPYLDAELHRDVNYISLYGIRDPEEIADKLCERAIRDKITQKTGKNTEGKGAQIASVVIGKLVKYGIKKIDFETDDIKSITDILPNYDNNVIIFDDLERCQCDVCAVLGYINDFIEHSDASVIIIANEEEIGKENPEKNQELQMQVALNPRLRFKLPAISIDEAVEEKRHEYEKKDTLKSFYTVDEVHRARKLIFQSGEQYRRTKEKVIGLTLNYVPDLKSVFSKLIEDNITDERLKDRIKAGVNDYVHMADREKHPNIRTFQFFLEKMEQIHSIISEDTYPALQNIAYYCFRSTISRMKGEKPPVWDDKEYGMQTFGLGIAPEDHPYGFRFVDELITSNTFDKEKAKGIVSSYCKTEIARGSLKNDPFQKLPEWYMLDDAELEEILKSINQNIEDGKYSTRIFPEIIKYLVYFKKYYLFGELCDQIINSMKGFIHEAPKDMMEAFAEERVSLERDDLVSYKAIMKDLLSCFEEAYVLTEEEYWKSLLEKEDWTTELINGLETHEGGKRSFVYWLDPEVLYEMIKGSNNEQLFVFRKAINSIYRSGYYYEKQKDDLPHLKGLRKLLDNTNEMGQIQKLHCGWIQNDLERWIKQIEPSEVDVP